SPLAKRRFLGRREPMGALCTWGARVTARLWTSRSTRARSVGIASTGKRIESRAEGPRDGPKGARWMAQSDRGHQSPGTALCNRALSSARIAIRTMMRFLRRRDCGQDRSPTIEGVAETFVALNRGPRVQAMEI